MVVSVRASKINFGKKDVYMIMFWREKRFFFSEILLFRPCLAPKTCMAEIFYVKFYFSAAIL